MTSQDILELSPISLRRSQSGRDSGFAPLPVLDRYRLSSLLGKGGMAEVFLAVWRVAPDVVRPVVVKRLYDHFSEDSTVVQMFIDEARLVCQLDHEHIVKTFEIGLIDGHLCIVMEYLEGQTLQQVMRRSLERNGIPVPLAAYIGQAVLAGLAFAHEATDARGNAREIVHRDISPHNIFITNTGAVKILDFGIAKARTHEARTSTGVVKGKFAYIAPEQAAGFSVDGRADLFSLGVVLWEMLAGRRLFKAEGDAATLSATLHRDIPFLTHVRADVPLDLAVVVSRALQRDPAKRYPNAATMLGELEKYLRRIKPKPDTSDLGELMHSHFAEEIPQQQQRVSELVLMQDAPAEADPPPPVSRQTVVSAERQREQEFGAIPKNKRFFVLLGLVGVLVGIGAAGLLVWNSARSPSESADGTPRTSPPKAPLVPTLSRELSKPTTEGPSAQSDAEPTAASPPAALAPGAVAAVARTSNHGKLSVAKTHAMRTATTDTTAALEAEAPTAKPAYGMLTIDTTPWSNVFVDGKLIGTTPLMQAKLPAGTRALTLRNPELGLEASYSVTILENQTVSKRIGLR